MQHLEPGYSLLTIGRAAALSVSLLALASCVSAVADDETISPHNSQQVAEAAPAASEETMRDEQEAGAGATAQVPDGEAGQNSAAMQPGLAMRGTALRATTSSIYGQSPPGPSAEARPDPSSQPTAAPSAVASPTMNAKANSLFSNGQSEAQPVIQPQQGAAGEAPATNEAIAAATPAATGESDTPAAVPLPLSAQAALSGATAAALKPVEVASRTPANAAQPAGSDHGEKETQETKKTWSLASLFGPKRREKQRAESTRAVPAGEKKTITASNAGQPQVASLAYTSLPGVNMNPLFSMEHEAHEADEDDAPVEVANLSGLARLTPSGLILQTEKVETGCFKPQLLDILKTVEGHYGRKVMVTSGLRAIKVNRKRQSLHTRCEAADIQVAGVSKWELANFLRNVPGRGGVGTYCHTNSVHIDIGPQRDWNWRCRRRKG
ncbi:D-Ala-D-Ala carboxypeptidase family metallohydrolase [Sinorhizobium sp. 22678]|uniref:D-Ala-D-Ala carboxypeptidase family metallohydrolase n=1 Tax=Sinorhizobium sp. 22678 TaxID=3453955 RepID=UPI003F83A787